MKEGRLKYFLAAIIAVVMWGFLSIPLRKIQHYPSDQILYYRIFVSLILTFLIIGLFRKGKLKTDFQSFFLENKGNRQKIIGLNILSGALICGNWFTYIYAVNNVNLKSAAFAYMVCPLITALGGFLILKERLSRIKFLALGVALLSILILVKGSLRDVLWSVFIASLYSFYLIIQKTMNRSDKFNMLAVHLFIAAIFILPLYFNSFKAIPMDLYFWIDIIIISVFFTIIPLFLSLYALFGMPSSTIGIIIYLNPIVAFAVAFFYFHEEISSKQIYAYTLLLTAVIVFNWGAIKEIFFKIPVQQKPDISP